jgi:hypothetical protein
MHVSDIDDLIQEQIRAAVKNAMEQVHRAEDAAFRDLLVARGWTPPDHQTEVDAKDIREATERAVRAHLARQINARIDVLGGQAAIHTTRGYHQGCLHGLDHALHMAQKRPHPADPT